MRVGIQDVRLPGTLGELSENDVHGDPGTPDDRLPLHDIRVDRDPVGESHPLGPLVAIVLLPLPVPKAAALESQAGTDAEEQQLNLCRKVLDQRVGAETGLTTDDRLKESAARKNRGELEMLRQEIGGLRAMLEPVVKATAEPGSERESRQPS